MMLKGHLAEKNHIRLSRCSVIKPRKKAQYDLWGQSRMGEITD